MKIYIAGPITGRDYNEAFADFEAAETYLRVMGHDPVNPMKKVSEQAGKTWAEYMREDIPLLLECEAIFMLKNWERSKGARLEYRIAKALGIKIRRQIL